MSKTETAKALFKYLGYLFGGISLIIMSLFALGYMMDSLIQTFGAETMPFLASLVPLLIMITGIAWGGYFIWKGVAAGDTIFDLVCKLADMVILNRMSHKAKVLIGTPPMLIGGIILAAVITYAAGKSLITGDVVVAEIITPLSIAGLCALFFGLVVTPKIKRQRMEQKSDEA